MSLNDEVELLRTIPLFANIEPSKLKLLAFTSERLTFRKGQNLCTQGEMGDAAFIIIDGEADVLVEVGGKVTPVTRVGKHSVVGEIAILCDVPRTATVQALTDVTVLRISKELFFRLVREFPQMGLAIMRELAQRLERTTSQLTRALGRVSE
ncbi:MAG: cyclic nucleotide-binding domain-containing protein [Alphaproteobacteria bacterium]|nr:cyclic nucleotide-binding domain-containing protein [Alphaproteobacteria bacterium]